MGKLSHKNAIKIARELDDPFFSDLRSDPDPFTKMDLQSDPILSPSWEKDLRSDTIRSFLILFRSFFDPFPIFITNFYGHFITQKLSQVINKKSDKFWSFYGNKNDSKFLHLTKKCFFKFSNKYFQADIMKKLVYFLKKGSGTESDPFRSDPWFFGSTIRSRSSGEKRIYDPITILQKEDLDPKGSRSDPILQYSGWHISTKT